MNVAQNRWIDHLSASTQFSTYQSAELNHEEHKGHEEKRFGFQALLGVLRALCGSKSFGKLKTSQQA
jgi:hypothetical protein